MVSTLSLPLKTDTMDNPKTLELDILISINQNKTIPTIHFHRLFEHKWKIYSSRFNELENKGLFTIVTNNFENKIYELTTTGKTRITELLNERESEITQRLALLKQQKPVTASGWESLIATVNSFIHPSNYSFKSNHSEPQSDYERLKAWMTSLLAKEPIKA